MKKFLKSARLFSQTILALLDRLLNRLTSYRLVLYFLIVLLVAATAASFSGAVPFEWYEIILSASWLVIVCYFSNQALSKRFDIPKNRESDLITALILALILTPPGRPAEWLFLSAAGLVAMASKYYLVLARRHIFNPTALGVFAVGAVFHYYPSWWVGSKVLLPITLLGALLVLRKIKRFSMSFFFVAVYLAIVGVQLLIDNPADQVLSNLWTIIAASPLIFFAVVMLPEPLTSPRLRNISFIYAASVAAFYGLPAFDLSLEASLLLGNVVTFLLDPNPRIALKFLKSREEADNVRSFIFQRKKGLKFQPGQYMEWTIPHADSDSRGNRRFLTVSSSPTEKDLMFTVRLQEGMSSYKRHIEKLRRGDRILVSQLSGSFILPPSENQKLAFIAGGIGITPFRSMIKYLIDFNQQRPIHLLYAANDQKQFAFTELFKEAEGIGLHTDYLLTTDQPPAGWKGLNGKLDAGLISTAIPDFAERTFYISGPQGFVHAVNSELINLGLPAHQIKTDFFPGYS